jgi:hypothetical protein
MVGLASALSAGDMNFSFGGFASQGFLATDHYNYLADTDGGTFEFTELALNATVSPFARTRVSGQLFAYDLGAFGDFEPMVDYLFLDYQAFESWGVRVGRIKRPSGIYNDIMDVDAARVQVFAPLSIYDPRYRDFYVTLDGVSFYGTRSAGDFGSFDWTIYGGVIHLDKDSGVGATAATLVSRSSMNAAASVEELETDHVYGGQLWFNANAGYRLGYSFYHIDNAQVNTRANRHSDQSHRREAARKRKPM